MSLVEKLEDFAGALTSATFAPDEYDPQGYATYKSNMDDLRALWAEIRARLKKDVDKVEFVDIKLQRAFSAFATGEKKTGQLAIWAIYNLQVTKLR